jgi:polyisoprenoid-binding protein YceI
MRTLVVSVWGLIVAAPLWAAPVYPLQSGSTLQFQGTQQGEKFVGAIKAFDAKIAYDPADLASSAFDVSMQMKTIDSKNLERDQAMQTADWFDTSHTPVATFKTVSFRSVGGGTVADADLTIKGRTKRIAFPFQFQKTATGATLDAKVALNRLDFALGAGEWSDDSMVGHRVDVWVHLVLGAAAPAPAPAPAKAIAKPVTAKPH